MENAGGCPEKADEAAMTAGRFWPSSSSREVAWLVHFLVLIVHLVRYFENFDACFCLKLYITIICPADRNLAFGGCCNGVS